MSNAEVNEQEWADIYRHEQDRREVAERERDEARAALAAERERAEKAGAALARLRAGLTSEEDLAEAARVVRETPLAPDTHTGTRQRWVLECAAARLEGREPPPWTGTTEDRVERQLAAERLSEAVHGWQEQALAAERQATEKWQAEVCDALGISRAHGWKDCASAIRSERERAEVAERALAETREALAATRGWLVGDQAFPLLSVLERLAAAVNHSLYTHACDADGYEQDGHAAAAALQLAGTLPVVVAAIDRALADAPPGSQESDLDTTIREGLSDEMEQRLGLIGRNIHQVVLRLADEVERLDGTLAQARRLATEIQREREGRNRGGADDCYTDNARSRDREARAAEKLIALLSPAPPAAGPGEGER